MTLRPSGSAQPTLALATIGVVVALALVTSAGLARAACTPDPDTDSRTNRRTGSR